MCYKFPKFSSSTTADERRGSTESTKISAGVGFCFPTDSQHIHSCDLTDCSPSLRPTRLRLSVSCASLLQRAGSAPLAIGANEIHERGIFKVVQLQVWDEEGLEQSSLDPLDLLKHTLLFK